MRLEILGLFIMTALAAGSAQALSRVLICSMVRDAQNQYVAEIQELEQDKYDLVVYQLRPSQMISEAIVVDAQKIESSVVPANLQLTKATFVNKASSLRIANAESRSYLGDVGYAGQLQWYSKGLQSLVQEDMVCWFSKRAKK